MNDVVRALGSACCGIGMLVAASPVSAQGVARSFEQLEVLVTPGQTVSVTDSAGTEIRGRIVALSPAALELSVNENRRTFGESDVRMVTHRRAIPGKGAKWGFFVGTGMGVLAAIAVAADDEGDYSDYGGKAGFMVGAIASYAGLGAGVGAGVGALLRRPHVVFERRSNSATLRLLPVLSSSRKGVGMSLSLGFPR